MNISPLRSHSASINRRHFLRRLAVGGAALSFDWTAFGDEALPPYSAQMPATPFEAPAGTWTLAVLPDTQNYSASYPQVYDRQCEWIVAHRQKHNILFVAHEGDITNDNNPPQWQAARRSMSILNDARMPYSLAVGNHDLGPEKHQCANRSTLLNDYFKEGDYTASAAFGLFEPAVMQNSWHTFDTPTGKHLVLALEYGPRDAVTAWAQEVVVKHADHKVILVTHAYLYSDSTRFDWAKYGKHQGGDPKGLPGLVSNGNVNDAQELWDKVIAKSSNVQFTLNGHVLHNGTGYLKSTADDGHPVHQILANYQAAVQVDDGAGGIAYDGSKHIEKAPHRAYGGGGFLRLMQFYPDGKTVAVKSYSPWYDRWLTQADQQFDVALS